MRRTIEDVEGAALVTDCPHRGCVYCEELDQIAFRVSWAECVGDVAVGEEVTAKLRSV